MTDLAELEATLEQPLTGAAQLAEKETVLQVTAFLLTCTLVACVCLPSVACLSFLIATSLVEL